MVQLALFHTGVFALTFVNENKGKEIQFLDGVSLHTW
jgi:hypothetical protein